MGGITGILGVTACGIGVNWNPADVAGSFSSGANWAWYSSSYDWKPFLAALLCSSIAMLLWCAVAYALRKRLGVRGPGISGLVMRVPGAKYVTATPNWLPEVNRSCGELPRLSSAGGHEGKAVAAKSVDAGVAAGGVV